MCMFRGRAAHYNPEALNPRSLTISPKSLDSPSSDYHSLIPVPGAAGSGVDGATGGHSGPTTRLLELRGSKV